MIVLFAIFASITAEVLQISVSAQGSIVVVKAKISATVISDTYQVLICAIILRILRIEVKNQLLLLESQESLCKYDRVSSLTDNKSSLIFKLNTQIDDQFATFDDREDDLSLSNRTEKTNTQRGLSIIDMQDQASRANSLVIHERKQLSSMSLNESDRGDNTMKVFQGDFDNSRV